LVTAQGAKEKTRERGERWGAGIFRGEKKKRVLGATGGR